MTPVETLVMVILEKLANPLIQELKSVCRVGKEVDWLELEFRRIQSFLKDADAKQEGDERVNNWVRDVIDVAYDAEDIIDTFLFKIAPLRQSGFVSHVSRYAFIFNEWIARHKVGSEIKRIKNKIRAISESRSTFGIENIGQGAGTSSAGPSFQDWRLTSPLDQEPVFVGFEKDLEILVNRLTTGELHRCVVSVVGMGGLGKTTLTKKVYNDTRVKTCFQSSAWISISQEYDVKDLLLNIINCFMVLSEEELKKVEKMNIIQLRHKISEYLQMKRYLMVLDDIWEKEAWDALMNAFPNMNNGSRVMLTTRKKDVASHADPHPRSLLYELRFLETNESWKLFCRKVFPGQDMRFLEKDESWKFFCRKAFPGQDIGCPNDLETLGREIVEKCHGLPLAIVVIGGLLSTKEPWQWKNVRNTISWQFVKGNPQTKKILSLSYRDLPSHLKPCFLYLGIFPEDYEIYAKKLIRLWAAEGFLQPRGDETLEEMGEECLKELIQRSMIQLASRSSSTGIKSCRIHDLLRDLSKSEAMEGTFLEVHHGNSNAPTSRARRLAIHHIALRECTSIKSSSPRLRSLLIHNEGYDMLQRKQEKFLYRGFTVLRVLDLHYVRIGELPSEIGALIHLKYLGCTKTDLERLPSSIGKLQNLQTLVVTSYRYVRIPSEIEKMQQLRHFQVTYAFHREYFNGWGVIEGHPRLDQISNLYTLTWVKAGEWMHGCLEKLSHLRKLGICLDGRMSDDEVCFESIGKLKRLQSLLVVTKGSYRIPPPSHLLTLRKLVLVGMLMKLPELTTNLTKLTLKSSHLKQDPLVTLEKLENLRILRLLRNSYMGVEMACTSKGFPRLESLHLQWLEELKAWKVEKGALPSLSHIQINSCHKLKMLPEGLQHVTTLKKLELLNMPGEFKERLREDKGEDWYKIHHILSIDIRK